MRSRLCGRSCDLRTFATLAGVVLRACTCAYECAYASIATSARANISAGVLSHVNSARAHTHAHTVRMSLRRCQRTHLRSRPLPTRMRALTCAALAVQCLRCTAIQCNTDLINTIRYDRIGYDTIRYECASVCDASTPAYAKRHVLCGLCHDTMSGDKRVHMHGTVRSARG
jgi:hypothetical protein